MYQVIAKSTNITTKDVLYEGVKSEYESYQQAARILKQIARAGCTAHRIPKNYIENIHAYVSWNHCGSSIRSTLYIKKS